MQITQILSVAVQTVGAAVGSMMAAWAQSPDLTPWYRSALVGLEVGPSGAQWGSDPRDTAYASRFNGREIVEAARKAGAEYVVLWARDGEWAYYDSKRMPKCPGLGDRDPLREGVAAARETGLPLIAYCVVQGGGWALREHPDWGMRDAQGHPIEGRFCLNSPYLQFVLELLDEMAAYGVDGFHVDMLDQGFGPPYGCWCDHCRARFAQWFPGEEMPSAINWDAAWDRMLEFRYRTCEAFEQAVTDHVKRHYPGKSVDFNYHGYPPFSFEIGQLPVRHAAIGDFATCETGTWAFSPLAVSLTAEFMRAAAGTKPYQVVMQRGVRMYHDQTNRPLNDLRWELFTLLSHGAQVTIVDKTPFEGQFDPVAWHHYGLLFEEAKRYREVFQGEPVLDVGLYFSARTRDWWAREEKDRYFTSFYGAHKVVSRAHLQWGGVLDETVSLERLERFPVMLLADTAILSDPEVELLEQYVRRGGTLIITAVTGCYDRYGRQSHNTALEKLIGAQVITVREELDHYFSFEGTSPMEEDFLKDIHPHWPHLSYGPAVVYAPDEAQAIGSLHAGVRTARQLEGKQDTIFPSPAGPAIGPAMLVHTVGLGTVVTLAVSPGFAAGSEYRALEPQYLLRNVIRSRLLRGDLPFQVVAPEWVDVCVRRLADNRYRILLTAYAALPASTTPKRPWVLPEMMTEQPMYRADVFSRAQIRNPRASRKDTQLETYEWGVRATVENVFEVLDVQVAAPDTPQ